MAVPNTTAKAAYAIVRVRAGAHFLQIPPPKKLLLMQQVHPLQAILLVLERLIDVEKHWSCHDWVEGVSSMHSHFKE